MKPGRKPRPKWQVQVDAYIYRYVDDPQTIKIQKNRIRELELTGTKTTPDYRPREGTSGESLPKQEKYVQEIEAAQEQIKICMERQATMTRLLKDYFDTEERQFIDLFWLQVPIPDRGAVWTRNLMVIHDIPWLRDPDKKSIPGREYWRWRTRIYNKFWELLFPDLARDESHADYIEFRALERER